MKKGQLAAKLVMFTFGVIWVMLYLYTGIFCFDFWRDILRTYAELEDGWFFRIMEVFYLLTVFGFGVLAARKVFTFVGEVEWSTCEEEKVNEN